MPETITLSAEPRARAGKGAARATRRAGRVPAIIYGDKQEPVLLSLDSRELSRALARRGFLATLVDVKLDGAVHRTLPRDVQLHPVSDAVLHVDFLRIGVGSRIDVNVPVIFAHRENSIGLRRGGLLNIVRHEVELNCPVEGIPEQLVVDLSGLDIGDSVHISAVALPEGVRPTVSDRDFTVATIAGSLGAREEAAAAAAAAAIGEAEPTEAG